MLLALENFSIQVETRELWASKVARLTWQFQDCEVGILGRSVTRILTHKELQSIYYGGKSDNFSPSIGHCVVCKCDCAPFWSQIYIIFFSWFVLFSNVILVPSWGLTGILSLWELESLPWVYILLQNFESKKVLTSNITQTLKVHHCNSSFDTVFPNSKTLSWIWKLSLIPCTPLDGRNDYFWLAQVIALKLSLTLYYPMFHVFWWTLCHWPKWDYFQSSKGYEFQK